MNIPFYQFLVWLSQPLWFALPIYSANLIPLLSRKLNFLNYPLDFNLKLKNKPLFGAHKTWRGLILGTLSAGLIASLQKGVFFQGIILGLATISGDLFGAFIKRRLAISPGEKNVLLDRFFDSIFALLTAYFFGFLPLSFTQCLYLVLISACLNKIANTCWFLLKIKENPW